MPRFNPAFDPYYQAYNRLPRYPGQQLAGRQMMGSPMMGSQMLGGSWPRGGGNNAGGGGGEENEGEGPATTPRPFFNNFGNGIYPPSNGLYRPGNGVYRPGNGVYRPSSGGYGLNNGGFAPGNSVYGGRPVSSGNYRPYPYGMYRGAQRPKAAGGEMEGEGAPSTPGPWGPWGAAPSSPGGGSEESGGGEGGPTTPGPFGRRPGMFGNPRTSFNWSPYGRQVSNPYSSFPVALPALGNLLQAARPQVHIGGFGSTGTGYSSTATPGSLYKYRGRAIDPLKYRGYSSGNGISGSGWPAGLYSLN